MTNRPTPSSESPAPTPLRAFVAYLNEENDAQATGVRVVEPPPDTKQAVRGSLFAVVELIGPPTDQVRVSERILSTLQRTYYTVRGSQSVVLAEAMRQATQALRDYNEAHPEQPMQGSIAVAALLRSRLIVACSGAALAIVREGRRVELFPGDPAVRTDGHESARWELQPGDVALLVGPAWTDRVPVRTLASTVAYVERDNCEDAAAGLREQGGGMDAPGLLLVLEAAGPAAPPGAAPRSGGPRPPAPPRPSTPLTGPRRATPGGLPTTFSTAPPVTGTPAPPPAPSAPAPEAPNAAVASGPSVPSAAQAAPVAAPAAAAGAPVSAGGAAEKAEAAQTAQAAQAAQAAQIPEAHAAPDPAAPAAAASAVAARPLLETAKGGLARARDLFGAMLPEKGGAVPPAEDEEPALPEEEPAAGWANRAAPPAASAPRAVEPELAAPPFVPPEPARGSRARLIIALALLIAVLVPVIVAAVYWQRNVTNEAQAQSLIALARARFDSAQNALDADDKQSALALLSEARNYALSAEEIIGRTDVTAEVLAAADTLVNEVADVQPLYGLASPLVSFPEGATPTRVLAVNQDIYVLDPARRLVESYRLDQTLEFVPEAQGTPVLRQGDVVDGVTVGPLLDMAWQTLVPGYDDKPSLLVLDANNQVFRYDPRVAGVGRLELEGQTDWGSVRQIETFQGRLYVADVGADQVLRYEAGRYGDAPTPWFSQPVNIDDMQAMRIDGEIWVLLGNGQILRYFSGEQMPFSLDSSVGLVEEPVDFVVGDDSNPFLYMADRGGERIWVFDKDGVYVKQLAAAEGNPLANLSGLYIEDVTDSMFLLTDQALYKHPLLRD